MRTFWLLKLLMEYKRKFISQAYDRPGTVLNDLNWLADFLMHVTPGRGGGGGLLPKNWVGRAPSFPKWPKSIPYKWPKRLKHTIPCRATYTNILPIYVEMGTPPLPLGFLLKYSSICEVRSKLISDASSNMADIHVHCSTNDRNLLRWCL